MQRFAGRPRPMMGMPPVSNALVNPPTRIRRFNGSPDTMRLMISQTLGDRGERSMMVRSLAERIVAGLQPKDYLSEILAIRNFVAKYVRYANDQLHQEMVKDPQRMVEEIMTYGIASGDCDDGSCLTACLGLCLGRIADFVCVGFGAPRKYTHVFGRIQDPKSKAKVVCDFVAGSDEAAMLKKVTTFQVWSLDG